MSSHIKVELKEKRYAVENRKKTLENKCGIVLAFIIGLVAFALQKITANPLLDPLFIAMLLGIFINSFFRIPNQYSSSINSAPALLIPIGVVLYGCVNLNFKVFSSIEFDFIFLILFVFIIYIITALFLSSLLKLKEKVGYLLTTGSTICGASAIVIASKAIDADSDEVSVSLVPIFISGMIGLFIVLPLVSAWLKMSDVNYGVLSGSVLQFTGFVKVAVRDFPSHIKSLAISVKAIRYAGLLFLIPLFASFSKGKFYIPWYLWGFLLGGLIFTFFPAVGFLRPVLKIVLTLFWSTAMAAVGLNASLRNVFSKEGMKAFAVSLFSFLMAVGVFLLGAYFSA